MQSFLTKAQLGRLSSSNISPQNSSAFNLPSNQPNASFYSAKEGGYRSTYEGIESSFKGISSSHQGVRSFSYGMHEHQRSKLCTSRFPLEASRNNPKWVFKNVLAPFDFYRGPHPLHRNKAAVLQGTWPVGVGPQVMLRESAEPEFYRFSRTFSHFSRLDMKSWSLRLT